MHPQQLLQTASELLAQVLKFDASADRVISQFFRAQRQLGQRERGTLAETVYRVLRRKALYELLARSAPKGFGSLPRKLCMLALSAPREFVRGALTAPEWAWVQMCDSQIDSGEGLLDVHRHNLPVWLAERLKAQTGEQFALLSQSLLEPAALDVRVNVFKTNREEASVLLAQIAIKNAATPYSPWGLRLQGKPPLQNSEIFVQGQLEVQDEGSQLLALLTGAKRGEMVVDFCAGAGGKTLALGAMMKNTGRLYAFDTSLKRLDSMKPRLARSGLSNIHPVAIDSERDERIKRLAGKIDRVLVDAPCSGMGTLRRNPDLKWRQTESSLAELVVKQTAILTSAARLLKSGGRLVYATCSLLQEENEEIARAFSAAHPDFVPLEAGTVLLEAKVPQAASLCAAEGDAAERYLRLWPQVHGTDGFFAAIWQRT